MNDVAPELLDKVKKQFEDAMKSDKSAADLLKKVEAGTATYADASKYSEIAGKKLSKALTDNITSDILPDGKMYYNIAQRILQPTLEDNHNMVADVATEVQQNLNDVAEIGLKAQRPDLNQDKIDGIINRISSTDNYDDIAWILGEPIINISMSTVDDTVKKNFEFQGKAGLRPRIIRKSEFKCCKWCSQIAGTYKYPDVPDDIYRRHENCRCLVEYDPGDGTKDRTNIWTKETTKKEIENRKNLSGVNTEKRVRKFEPILSENVTSEYFRNAKPNVGDIIYSDGYNKQLHKEEISAAEIIHKELGGDIRLITEKNQQNIKSADYEWNNRLWDLKCTSTENAANSAIRHGLVQIKDNPGGIILNYGNKNFTMEKLMSVIDKRMQWNHFDENIDIIIMAKNHVIKVLRYKK